VLAEALAGEPSSSEQDGGRLSQSSGDQLQRNVQEALDHVGE
jgi:hypothetical protein